MALAMPLMFAIDPPLSSKPSLAAGRPASRAHQPTTMRSIVVPTGDDQ